MKLRKALAWLAAAVMLGASPLFPAQAQAALVYGCDTGYLCLYDGTNYGTYRWTSFSLTYLFQYPCTELTGGFDNSTSSLVVNAQSGIADHAIFFYMNHGCKGEPTPWITTRGQTAMPNLTSTPWGNISNAISSIGPLNP